jgi:hypothetical protein
MKESEKDKLIPQLEEAHRRFDAWRARRKVGEPRRIPQRLWRPSMGLTGRGGRWA